MGSKRPTPEKGIAPYVGVSDINRERIRDALLHFDFEVSEIEAEWGIDRLPDLVDMELRDRFNRQMQKLNDAIRADDGHEVKRQVVVTLKGYAKLIEVATANGHKPLTGEAWEAQVDDGSIVCITRNPDEACKAARERKGVTVYSVDEVARIITMWQRDNVDGMVAATKAAFEGAQVAAARYKDEVKDDELPF